MNAQRKYNLLLKPCGICLRITLRPTSFPMRIPSFLLASASLILPCKGAVSILVQPGVAAETTFYTVTQSSPSPSVNVSGLSGYSFGMLLPTVMFNVASFEPGYSSDIFGELLSPIASVREAYSGQSFLLSKLWVRIDPGMNSLLGFDRLFTIPIGASTLRFDVESLGPVELNIAYEALQPGVHVVNDTLFGQITVTVIPEPMTGMLALAAAGLCLRRRRRA